MDNKPTLSPEAHDCIEAFCKQISVAHELDAEIQRELRAHMEDKLLAYLSGEDPVTEADALILVREHFGDPATLKGLLREVHGREARITFFRRFAAACAAFLAMWILLGLCDVALGFWHMRGLTEITGPPRGGESFNELVRCAGAAAFWGTLYLWQRRVDDNRPVWFLKWRAIPVGLVLLLLAIAAQLTPTILYRLSAVPAPIVLSNGITRQMAPVMIVIHGGGYAYIATTYAAWLWWWDRAPRSKWALIAAFCTLSVLYLAAPLVGSSAFPHSMLLFASDAVPQGLVSVGGSVPGSSLVWQISLEPAQYQWPLREYLSGLMGGGLMTYRLHQVAVGLAVCVVYAAITRTGIRHFLGGIATHP